MTVVSVYAPSGHSTREQLASERFFEGLQNYIGNKNEGNENKVILGNFNCTMDKMDRDGGNKTQKLLRCCSNYALSKLTVRTWLKDLWRRENPDSSEFTLYDRSFRTRSRLGKVYTDMKIVNNIKINHIMISFTDLYNVVSIDRLPSRTEIGKDSWYFNNSLSC